MPADYDLIVLGGSLEGRVAAVAAVGYGARVALVEPPSLFVQRQQQRYLLEALLQLGEGAERRQVVDLFKTEAAIDQSQWDWQAILKWSAIAAQTQEPELSVAAMSESGIDVVLEPPERLSRQLVVTTATRRMKARSILAAFGTVPISAFEKNSLSPDPTGIEALLNAVELPESIYIWGDSTDATTWAEALQTIGVQVTLVSDNLLPYEDWDIRRLMYAQLIATGTRILSTSVALQEVENTSDLCDRSLLFGKSRSALVLPDFVYHSVGKYPDTDEQQMGRTYLLANKYLQTLHPRVFACGSLLSGLPMQPSVAKAEAQTAVYNALFLSIRQVQYQAIPEGHQRLARVGLTPRFAREGKAPEKSSGGGRNAAEWDVWTSSDCNGADLTRMMPGPYYCKLICYKGRLQSIHLLGTGANELIELMAGWIGRPITSLPDVLPTTGSLVALVKAAVISAQSSRWQPGRWRRDWSENWFNWRRSQSR